MAWVHGFMEWVVLVALSLGAMLAVWLLDACTAVVADVCRRLSPKTPPRDYAFLGGLLFLFLMIGVPILVVGWGFATGALPHRP